MLFRSQKKYVQVYITAVTCLQLQCILKHTLGEHLLVLTMLYEGNNRSILAFLLLLNSCQNLTGRSLSYQGKQPSAEIEGASPARVLVSWWFPTSRMGETVSSAARSTCWRPHHHQPICRYASSSSINAKRRCSNGLSGALLKVLH